MKNTYSVSIFTICCSKYGTIRFFIGPSQNPNLRKVPNLENPIPSSADGLEFTYRKR
jgi:hypothetical protein